MSSLALLLATICPAQDDGGVIEVASPHFRLVTDLSAEEAGDLLEKLETMLGHVQKYWGRRLPKPIDMYVAKNLNTWPAKYLGRMSPDGIASIKSGGGLTIRQTARLGSKWDSRCIVYATSERGTAQHEAVHAYSGLAFGETGPVWYAEGMAEVGQYWRKDDPAAVHAHPVVIQYLKGTTPKPLEELVSTNQRTGDSWRNYASRWALCHLLGNNPNYNRTFKPLGLQMLAGKPVTFADAYGHQAAEIEFEYKLLLDNLCEGYRADLCSWDWRSRLRKVSTRGNAFTVKAARGWQTTTVLLDEGETYVVTATGEWDVDEETETTADGAPDGRGRLVATIFSKGQLSEPIELGSDVRFTAPTSGQFVVRCRDDWGAIGDNGGQIKGRIMLAKD